MHRMFLLPRVGKGNSTRKSIKTNSVGALGNSLIPIFRGFCDVAA